MIDGEPPYLDEQPIHGKNPKTAFQLKSDTVNNRSGFA